MAATTTTDPYWENEVSRFRKPTETKRPMHFAVPTKTEAVVKKKKNDKKPEEEDVWVKYKGENGKEIWYNGYLGEARRSVSTEEKKESGESAEKPQFAALSTEEMLTMISRMGRMLDHILDQSTSLSSMLVEELRETAVRLANIHTQIHQGGSLDDRDDVEALIDFNKIKWKWDNWHVHQYRREAVEHEHECFQDWHMPQFFSKAPLPQTPDGKDTILVHVNLPKPQPIDNTKVPMGPKDTVDKAIRIAFSKMKGEGLGDETHYVLKAEALRDYMEADRVLYDYEYVRQCIRDGVQVTLSLVRRPEPIEWNPEHDHIANYRERIDWKLNPVPANAHRGVSTSVPFTELTELPLSEMHIPLKFKVIGVDNVTVDSLPRFAQQKDTITQFYLKAHVFHGIEKIEGTEHITPPLENATELRFNHVIQSDLAIRLSSLPRESRIGFELYAKSEKDILVAWAVIQMIDEKGHLVAGRRAINLWAVDVKGKGHKKKANVHENFIYMATTRENHHDERPVTLLVEFDSWELPVVAPLVEKYRPPDPRNVGVQLPAKSLPKKLSDKLTHLTTEADPLETLTDDDKQLLWTYRHSLTRYPAALPKFLLSVNWGRLDHKFEAHRLLKQWAALPIPENALELLDVKYPDYTVRKYAVDMLRQLDDDQVRLYMLQLVQCLKFEAYHHSPLSRFLIERSLKNPLVVGHYFFWHLKAELHNPHWTERFSLLLEEYLTFAGRYATELRKQNGAVLRLQKVAEMIVKLKRKGKTDDEAMEEYTKELKRLNKEFFEPNGKFAIPYNPKLEAKRLIIPKCRYMSSKMVPLWLVFENADEDVTKPILIIFKSGDDLRQDILTLQLLQAMDKLWLAKGIDLKMTPYEVIATGVNEEGEGVGMIQVVPDSDTTSGIQLKYGGGAVGALRLDPIEKFLKQYNPEGPRYEKAVDHFIASCAGYCVATYILGIGDRHNGNIMVTKDGHLFHIDFGHFLGNFKKKFGVNRERAAFVFTPEMAYVIGGKRYKKSDKFGKFLELSSLSYKALRDNANILEALFMLMVPAGMPELMREEDIHYLRDKLMLDVPWKKADKKLHAEIQKSLDTTYRRIDNMIHNFKHGV